MKRAIDIGKTKGHEVKFGELCDDDARRDAVHVAVAPVTAAQILMPGEHVGWADETLRTVARVGDPFGIVDPCVLGYPLALKPKRFSCSC